MYNKCWLLLFHVRRRREGRRKGERRAHKRWLMLVVTLNSQSYVPRGRRTAPSPSRHVAFLLQTLQFTLESPWLKTSRKGGNVLCEYGCLQGSTMRKWQAASCRRPHLSWSDGCLMEETGQEVKYPNQHSNKERHWTLYSWQGHMVQIIWHELNYWSTHLFWNVYERSRTKPVTFSKELIPSANGKIPLVGRYSLKINDLQGKTHAFTKGKHCSLHIF